jgi:hypothetical protein
LRTYRIPPQIIRGGERADARFFIHGYFCKKPRRVFKAAPAFLSYTREKSAPCPSRLLAAVLGLSPATLS